MRDKALQRAIKQVGGTAELARQLKISSQAISQWRRIPHGRVEDVSRITGIPADELRPDLAKVFRTEAA